MYGLHGTLEADMGFSSSNKHTSRERLGMPTKYNLIMMAMNAGMTTPTSTPTQTPAPTPTTSAASQLGLPVVMFSILSLASCVLSSF